MSGEGEVTIADRVTEIPAVGRQTETPALQAEAIPPGTASNDNGGEKITAAVPEPAIKEPDADEKEAALRDARRRAELQGLTGPAVDIKVRLELAFRRAIEVPEGEDTSVILLATLIAAKAATCLDRRSQIAVSASTINEMGRLRPTISKNAKALIAAAEQVL